LTSSDEAQVMSLNLGAQPNVALLDGAELARLRSLSDAHVVVHDGDAVIAYALLSSDGDAYDGEEFLAFRSLLDRAFTYIDQVVVHESVRGTGVGRRLYEAVERASIARGALRLCCEVNVLPPNPDSLAFHGRMGFESAGTLDTRDGRRVNLLHKRLPAAA
jgi:predicted GNAT superfamily acetyltransferase